MPSTHPNTLGIPASCEGFERAATGYHGALPFVPLRTLPIALEERFQRTGRIGMVHPHDPFAPSDVADGRANAAELPIEQRRHGKVVRIEERVLGPEITVQDDMRRGVVTWHEQAGIERMKSAQQRAARSEDLLRMTCVDQVLALLTRSELGGDRPIDLSIHDRRNGHDVGESRERSPLSVSANNRLRSQVGTREPPARLAPSSSYNRDALAKPSIGMHIGYLSGRGVKRGGANILTRWSTEVRCRNPAPALLGEHAESRDLRVWSFPRRSSSCAGTAGQPGASRGHGTEGEGERAPCRRSRDRGLAPWVTVRDGEVVVELLVMRRIVNLRPAALARSGTTCSVARRGLSRARTLRS